MNRIEREIRDLKLNKCGKCCINCPKYKSVKEQNALCEAKKARARMINRELYRARKAAKKEAEQCQEK